MTQNLGLRALGPDLNQQIADLQTALRVLWPDRPKVTFPPHVEEGVHQLTYDESQMLSRVALALAEARVPDHKLYLSLDDVNATLAEYGITFPTGLVGIRALGEQLEVAHRPCMKKAWTEGYNAGDRDCTRAHETKVGYAVEPGEDVTRNPYAKES